ncbi:amino acid ABC transporter permease [Nocardioides sp. LMS-CY]|uniref:amino acid ABC transporter permease n=1 Tax=Nocardioides sp. (strain LMS-CY) TaxID=2840457 RepID=UPI0020797C4A|nr:amino acid ABC transporter permease [Nocardioides sp. LMS-CY]
MSEWSPSPRELERRGIRRSLRTRSILVATIAMIAVFALLVIGLVSSPGWDRVQDTFFNWHHARESFPDIWDYFWVNVKIFLIAEPLILVVGLAVALARQARAAILTPLRVLAVAYTDVLRGIPTVLLILLMGFGVPALQLQGVTNSALVWATVALVLSYSAYVAEVFRAGIESIHPSQLASAEALGLSRAQTMRHVVVPQAVRRVVPPLLNDFVSLQKDTALVSLVGVLDAVFAARDYGNYNFNYTPLVVVAGFFVVITIPLARLCDWLQRRMVEKERAGSR